jgi:hypothetical protein
MIDPGRSRRQLKKACNRERPLLLRAVRRDHARRVLRRSVLQVNGLDSGAGER